MRKALPIVIAVLLAAAACSSSSDPAVGVSGDRPTPAEPAEAEDESGEEEGGEEPAVPMTEVVEIPDVSDLGLTWSEPISVNETTGAVDLNQFNRYMVEESPTGTTGEEAVAVFLGLAPGDDSAQMLVDDRGFGTKTITVVLAGEDDSVRAVRYVFSTEVRDRNFAAEAAEDITEAEEGFEGDAAEGSGGDTESVAEDDLSTEEESTTPESEGEVVDAEPIAWIISGTQTTQCQPGRGHQDFIVELCI